MSTVAVIPARGGSKRIPRKNIRDFCGKPMIAWSIEAALGCGLFDRVIVSTDDDEVAMIARSGGADVPFVRPASLSDDHTGTLPVMAHAAHFLLDQHVEVGPICCIYPTAPLIQKEDLISGYEVLTSGRWQFVFSATEFAAPIWRSFHMDANGAVSMFFPEHESTRSQDLPRPLHDAAQFYWGWADAWCTQSAIFGPHSTTIELPRWRVQDVDTPEDWDHLQRLAATMNF